MGVSVVVVQQVVQVGRVVWVVRWEGVMVLMSTGQLAVVAEVVKVLVILLYGSCSREARAGAAVLPDGRRQKKGQDTEEKNSGGGFMANNKIKITKDVNISDKGEQAMK